VNKTIITINEDINKALKTLPSLEIDPIKIQKAIIAISKAGIKANETAKAMEAFGKSIKKYRVAMPLEYSAEESYFVKKSRRRGQRKQDNDWKV